MSTFDDEDRRRLARTRLAGGAVSITVADLTSDHYGATITVGVWTGTLVAVREVHDRAGDPWAVETTITHLGKYWRLLWEPGMPCTIEEDQ